MLDMKNRIIFKNLMDKCLIGTQLNYSTFNLADSLSLYVMDNISSVIGNYESHRDVLSLFSPASNLYGIALKSEMRSFCKNHDISLSAEMLKTIFSDFMSDLRANDKTFYKTIESDKFLKSVYNSVPVYIRILEVFSMCSPEEKEEYLNDNKEVLDNLDDGIDILYYLFSSYIDGLDASLVFDDNLEEIPELSKSAYNVLTNVDGFNLKNSFNGSLLEGDIQVSTDRGYPDDESRPQQDAALSIVRSNECFLNMIADGAGGSELGERASLEITKGIEKWFLELDDEVFSNIDLLVSKLIKRIKRISDDIFVKYENSYTTLVLALTVFDKTIILNVGDSTAYSFDFEKDELCLLTVLDSWANGYYYEDVRWYAGNNVITAAIGDGYRVDPHVNIIDNDGQTIILSSDGVTDLVSDETFISYFKKETLASKIVEDALLRPEVSYEFEEEPGVKVIENLPKQADNISAIVVKLPDKRSKCKKI